jgi:pimeloyl-ACP methyl ester carboxylesterase
LTNLCDLKESRVHRFRRVLGYGTPEWNVRLIQPHQPGRIPVILFHGLSSSPYEPWRALVDVLADKPWFVKSYEFWLIEYPSGQSLLFNSLNLRTALGNVRKGFLDLGPDPALNEMVLIGHSMGGLVATLLTHDSDSVFWDTAWKVPCKDLDLSDLERKVLMDLFFFKRLQFVTRVVLIGAPLKGSPLASNRLAKVARRLIWMWTPESVIPNRILKKNAEHARVKHMRAEATGPGMLREGSFMVKALSNLHHPSGVLFHGIVGNIKQTVAGGTDGVVAVESAYIDWAISNLEVDEQHRTLPRHPDALREIKRILQENLALRHPTTGHAHL